MSSGGIDPLSFAQNWDALIVGSTFSPGVCTYSGFKRKFEFDKKKGKGTVGGTLTFVQRPPAEGSFKFLLWLPSHFQLWDTFRPLFKYDPTKKSAQAIDIYHPALADLEIYSAVCASIGPIMHEGEQLYSIEVDLIEYSPPPKTSAVSTPNGAAGTAGGSTPGTPPKPALDANQLEIQRLLALAQAP